MCNAHKTICLITLTVVLSVMLCATVSAENNDGQFYRNKDKRFSLYFPKGWSIEKGRNPHVVVKSRSPDRIASILVTVTDNVGNDPVTKALKPEDMIKKYIESGWDSEVLSSGKMTFWNEEGMYVMFVSNIQHMNQAVKMIQWQLIFNHQGKGYIISYGVAGINISDRTAAGYYDKYNPFFLKSLSSFALEDWNR